MKNLLERASARLSVVRNGTGSVTLAILALLVVSPFTASARTVYQADGLILSISENKQEVVATWEDRSNGNLMLGASRIDDGFSSIRMLSADAYRKVAISGTGEDKVAISGTGENKVAISGTGESKVAISGTGEGKTKIEGTSLEIFVSNNEVYGMLTINRKGETVEHVFDFSSHRALELAEIRTSKENTDF